MAENSSWTSLSDKYAILFQSRLHSILIEGFGIEFITRTTLNWVCKIAYDHVVLLGSVLELRSTTWNLK